MDNINNTLPQGFLLRGSAHTYRIERVLGQGSFGITYLATTKVVASGSLGSFETTINVAVKEFFMSEVNGRENSTVTSGSQGGLFDNYKRKFAREADNLSKLSHPHIVRVLELFEANNTFYYSMEYCESGSLDEEIERRGGLPEKDALNYIQQISDALSYMHNRQVLHLDLKPSNIMRRTPQEVILIDFGLSKHYDTSGNPESSTTIGGGTPGYSPIEQANYRSGDKLAVTLDVYALGATLYKMLTGKRPPVATDIFNEGFPREELEQKGVSGATISCIEKAMSSAKRARYQSVEEFVSALSSHVSSASSEETDFVPPKSNDANSPKPKPSKPQEKSEPILNNPEASKPTDNNKPQKQSRKINWFMLGWAALIVLIVIWTLFIVDVLRSQSAAENTPAVEVPVTPEETPAQSTASKSKPVKKTPSQSTTSKSKPVKKTPAQSSHQYSSYNQSQSSYSKTYKVGDYYDANGKQGVVFVVTPDGKHGKIVGLNNLGRMKWDDAIAACRNLGNGWRLPSKEELLAIYKVKSTLNSTLAAVGDELPSVSHWSSTEYNSDCAWFVYMNAGRTYDGSKNDNRYVRAVSAF